MKKSLLDASRLVRLRLLATNCELVDPAKPLDQLEIEISHQINLVPQPKDQSPFDFFVDMATTVNCRDSAGQEAATITCKFRGDYKTTDEKFSGEDFIGEAENLANQLYLKIRSHLSYLFIEIGIDPGFLPFSLYEPEQRALKK